jgi:hypothetical protein
MAVNDAIFVNYGGGESGSGTTPYPNGTWVAIHVPAADTKATITKAAAGAGTRNVCIGFTVTLSATASAPSAVQLTVALVDGATTGTDYLWRSVISLPATAGAQTTITRTGCYLRGSINTAMTLEFSAAGGASTVESVSLEGTIE